MAASRCFDQRRKGDWGRRTAPVSGCLSGTGGLNHGVSGICLFYDEFNGAADYDALFAYVTGELKAHGIQDGIVADFGCGTGELTLMLAQAGYDMIGIDVSEEMLSVLRDKADALGLPLTNPMLLCQDLLQLDLYGTIRAAVSTFDTYNHIGPLENFEKAIAKAAFFMEKTAFLCLT